MNKYNNHETSTKHLKLCTFKNVASVLAVVYVLLGRAVTEYRWGGIRNILFMRHKFLVLTVKKLLKSVYIYGSYRKIKTGLSLFLDHSVYTMCQKTRQIWNGIAENYKDRFWWNLAEIFQILWNRVCVLQFSCRFAFLINFSSFTLDTENNANFYARCTIVQSAVLRLHVVRPSVCPSDRLWRWWIRITQVGNLGN